MTTPTPTQATPCSPGIIPTPHEFEVEAEVHLGRANGNVYQSVQGMYGFHDGRIFVRLKSKRFVVLDYSMVPDTVEWNAAKQLSYVKFLDTSGTALCSKADVSSRRREM
jgi:ribosomal protein L24E